MTIIQRKGIRATYRRREGNWWIDADQGYFYDPLPQVVTCDRRLSHRAKLVYSMVSGLSRQNGWCTMSQTTLAVFVGSSRDSVNDDLRCLVTAGLLEESPRLGYPNGYRPVYLEEVYGDDYLKAMRFSVLLLALRTNSREGRLWRSWRRFATITRSPAARAASAFGLRLTAHDRHRRLVRGTST